MLIIFSILTQAAFAPHISTKANWFFKNYSIYYIQCLIHVCGMLLRGLLAAINAAYYACYGIGQPLYVPNPIASSTITTGQLHWSYTPSWSPDSHVPKDSVILSIKLVCIRGTDPNFFGNEGNINLPSLTDPPFPGPNFFSISCVCGTRT